MSGHSRWSTIKHKKAAADSKRSKVWTKIIRELTVAARSGGGDASGNPRLRTAVDKARAANMPGDTVERAIKKGTGEGGDVQFEELVYEAYGPGGTAVYVDVLTDNKNRTASEIRHVLERNGGKLAAAGSVAYLFKKQGVLTFEGGDEDRLTELGIELGADDVRADGGVVTMTTEPGAFVGVKEALAKRGVVPSAGEVAMVPSTTVKLEGKDAAQMLRLLTALEDHDDVQGVAANFDIDAELLEQLTA